MTLHDHLRELERQAMLDEPARFVWGLREKVAREIEEELEADEQIACEHKP